MKEGRQGVMGGPGPLAAYTPVLFTFHWREVRPSATHNCKRGEL